MKINKLIIAAILVFGVLGAGAQTKVAHINTTELVKTLPDFMKAQKELEAYNNQLQEQLTTLVSTYRKKVEEYNNLPDTTMPILLQTYATEIKQIEDRITAFKDAAQKEAAAKEEALLTPIFKKVQDAINAVAKEKGFDYVLNVSSEEVMLLYKTVLYYDDKNDITLAVKKKLGIM